jgi:hypothetical protein
VCGREGFREIRRESVPVALAFMGVRKRNQEGEGTCSTGIFLRGEGEGKGTHSTRFFSVDTKRNQEGPWIVLWTPKIFF